MWLWQLWHHRQAPNGQLDGTAPRMEREVLDRQWKTALENALDLGQPKALRDNGDFHWTLYHMLFTLTPNRTAHDELVSLPARHLNLVHATLFQYLERHHKELLFRAHRSAGDHRVSKQLRWCCRSNVLCLQAAAEKLCELVTETSHERQQRRAELVCYRAVHHTDTVLG